MICINKHLYYRISIPVDLKKYFPVPVIQKSLKSTNVKDARPLLFAAEYKVQQAFAMIRTGMMPDEVIQQVVDKIVLSKQKAAVVKGKLLSEIITQYVVAKESGWTAKSKMEFNSIFKLIVDVLGDSEVASITKPVVTELRSKLQKLPPNVYK